MKTIKKSGKRHWAIGRQVGCDQCDSIYEIENEGDFQSTINATTIKSWCPECKHGQLVSKITWHYAGTTKMPTYTWDFDNDTLKKT